MICSYGSKIAKLGCHLAFKDKPKTKNNSIKMQRSEKNIVEIALVMNGKNEYKCRDSKEEKEEEEEEEKEKKMKRRELPIGSEEKRDEEI